MAEFKAAACHGCRMLSRELKDLLLGRDGTDFAADAVDDDVFQWELIFNHFAPACPLAQACPGPRLQPLLYQSMTTSFTGSHD